MARDHRVVIHLGSVDATNSDERAVWMANIECQITGIWLIDDTAKVGHASNHGHYTVTNKGIAGSGSAVPATRNTDDATVDDIAAWVPWPITLSETIHETRVAAGEVLTFKATESGTEASGDLNNATLIIEYGYGH